MASNSHKVYVVDSQKVVRTPRNAQVKPGGPPEEKDKKLVLPAKPVRPKHGSLNSWKPLLLAYLLGPVILPLKSTGRRFVFRSILGPGSVVVGILLLAFRSSIFAHLESGFLGVLSWLVIVTMVVLSLTTAWALAISSAHYKHSGKGSKLTSYLQDPRCLSAMGLLVPGLGLMITGRPKRAAWAFWILGPLTVASLILLNWRRLWECGRISAVPGISGVALETVFLTAAAVALLAALAWITQALDGGRLVSSHRSNKLGDRLNIALLVSLVLLIASFHPVSFAQQLHSASVVLQQNGFKLIPLKLNEAAMRLDSASPVYLANAAELNEKMGMIADAQAKRELLELRAKEYSEFIPRKIGDNERLATEQIESRVGRLSILDGPPGVYFMTP